MVTPPFVYNGTSVYENGLGGFDFTNCVNILPINKIVVVDKNGYIGYDLTDFFQYIGNPYYYNYALLSKTDDFSSYGLGRVTFYTPSSSNIGGIIYETAVINGKEWMAQNLDFKFSGLSVGQNNSNENPRANYYNDDENTFGINGNKYGLLYNWIAAKYLNDNKLNIIPGWHVPTISEWDDLINAVGGSSVAGTKLKSISGWSSGNGDNAYGFNAFPAGCHRSGSFLDIRDYANFWTINEYSPTQSNYKYLSTGPSISSDVGNKANGFSIRLVKD